MDEKALIGSLDEVAGPDVPVVLLAAGTDHALVRALAKVGGIALTKRSLFSGSAHPTFLPCLRTRLNDKAAAFYDAGGLWGTALSLMFNDYFIPEFLTAIDRASALVFAPAEGDMRSMAIAQIARAFGVKNIIGLAVNRSEADVHSALGSIAEEWANARVISGSLNGSKSAVKLADQLFKALEPELIIQHHQSEPPLFIPAKLVNFGLTPGMFRAFGKPWRGTIQTGDILEAVAAEGVFRADIKEVDDNSVIFAAPGANAKRIRALAAPGKVKVVERARGSFRIRGKGEGRLYALGSGIGLCQVEGDGICAVSDPMPYGHAQPGIVCLSGAPFFIGHETNESRTLISIGTFC